MANCVCSKEADISAIRTKVDELHKVISGNGQPGLRETVPILMDRVNTLIDRLDKQEESKKFNISTIISIAAVIIALLVLILK